VRAYLLTHLSYVKSWGGDDATTDVSELQDNTFNAIGIHTHKKKLRGSDDGHCQALTPPRLTLPVTAVNLRRCLHHITNHEVVPCQTPFSNGHVSMVTFLYIYIIAFLKSLGP
jgi:hypothetical protein